MIICQGPVKSRNLKLKNIAEPIPTIECLLCSGYLKDNEKLTCISPKCDLVAHISCLADKLLPAGEYIPIEGPCPFCNIKLIWGDLIRKMKGCNAITYDSGKSDELKNDELCNDESDDDVVCTQYKTFVDTPSWFLDCNEDL